MTNARVNIDSFFFQLFFMQVASFAVINQILKLNKKYKFDSDVN